MEKVVKFFNTGKAIWGGMIMFAAAIAYAGDSRWVQKTEYNNNQKTIIIQQINREISEAEIKLLYITNSQEIAMLKAIVINKQTQIKNIREQ